jgi:hypothetical protein
MKDMDHRATEPASMPIGHPAAEDVVPMRTGIRVKEFTGFYIIGPVHSLEIHGDGTIVRKTHHQNGVTDVEVERCDGSITIAIEDSTIFPRKDSPIT